MAELPVTNHDIYSLVRRINDYSLEVSKSQSANIQGWRERDKERLNEQMDAIEAYLTWFQGQPEVDRPESHPTEYTEDDTHLFGFALVENQMVNDVIQSLWSMKYELLHSQSARLANRLLSFDEQRIRDEIARLRNFFTDYIEPFTPLDLPESTPEEMPVTAGRRGTSPKKAA